MRTPQIIDSDCNTPNFQILARIAKISLLKQQGLLRGLGAEILLEGEDARVIFVRGTYFRLERIAEIFNEVQSGEFTLLPEPDNSVDPGAVAVILDGEKIGYLPMEIASYFQPMVAAGTCRIAAQGLAERTGTSFTFAVLLAWQSHI